MSLPITITDLALEKILAAKKADSLDDSYAIRASVKGGGCSGFTNTLVFDNEITEDDTVQEFTLGDDKVMVVMDAFSQMYSQNVTIDYELKNFEEGFSFKGGSSDRRHCACGSSFSE